MTKKRFIIEMGTGVDQHGQSVTVAATRAVKDTVSRVCLIGLLELVDLKSPEDMIVDVLVANAAITVSVDTDRASLKS